VGDDRVPLRSLAGRCEPRAGAAPGGTAPVTRFTVQYEIVEDDVYPAVRYDSAHGQPHRDIMDRRGRVIDKKWIAGKTYNDIVNEAIADLKANWSTYRALFEQEDAR